MMTMCGRNRYTGTLVRFQRYVVKWQLRYNLHMKFTFDMPDEWVTAIDRLRKKYVSRADLGREAVKDYLIKHGQSIECGPVVVKQRKNGAVKKLPEPQPS